MKKPSSKCPSCETGQLHQTGGFLVCGLCGLVITEQALAYARNQERTTGPEAGQEGSRQDERRSDGSSERCGGQSPEAASSRGTDGALPSSLEDLWLTLKGGPDAPISAVDSFKASIEDMRDRHQGRREAGSCGIASDDTTR